MEKIVLFAMLHLRRLASPLTVSMEAARLQRLSKIRLKPNPSSGKRLGIFEIFLDDTSLNLA